MRNFFAKNYLIVVIIAFILSILSGAIDTVNNFDESKKSFESMIQFLTPLKGRSDFQIFLFIFLNNSLKGLLAIGLFFVFGIYSISMVLTNGVMIGTAAVIFAKIKSVSWVLAALLPHGIIEIPALLLASAVSLRLGHIFFKNVFLKGKNNLRAELRRTLTFYVKFLLPMYLLAAVIEAFITPKIITLFQ